MQPVYGRKTLPVNGAVHETWMDRFTQLEPEGGFCAAVQRTWSGIAPTVRRAGPVNFLNGRVAMSQVYGLKRLSAEARVSETWMDRFTNLEPDSGFRAVVEHTWKWSTPTSGRQVTSLAA